MYNKTPAYYLNEIKSERVEIHEPYGRQVYTATLCEYFGDFFIILISYSGAKKINCEAHSFYDAEREFDNWIARSGLKVEITAGV